MDIFVKCSCPILNLAFVRKSILGTLALVFALLGPLAGGSVLEKKCAELLDPHLATLRSNSQLKGNFWQTPWGNQIRFEFKLERGGSGALIVDEATKDMELKCKLEKSIAADAQNAIRSWYQEYFGQSPKAEVIEAEGFVSLSFKGLHQFSAVQTKKFVERI